MTERSLFDRLGGVNAIADGRGPLHALVKNPKLNVNPALAAWNETAQLPDLKFMRTLWLCEIAGSNFHYSGKSLGDAHRDLHITADEFDEAGPRSGARSTAWRCPSARRTRFSPRSSRTKPMWSAGLSTRAGGKRRFR